MTTMTSWWDVALRPAAAQYMGTRDKAAEPVERRDHEDRLPKVASMPSADAIEEMRAHGDELTAAAWHGEALWRAAYHEASHAFVAFTLGAPVDEIRIDGGCGHTLARPPGVWDTTNAGMLLAAGRAGEEFRFSTVDDGDDDDEEILDDLLATTVPAHSRSTVERQVRQAAADLVRNGQEAISVLARALVRRGHLNGDEVRSILTAYRATGPVTPTVAPDLDTLTLAGLLDLLARLEKAITSGGQTPAHAALVADLKAMIAGLREAKPDAGVGAPRGRGFLDREYRFEHVHDFRSDGDGRTLEGYAAVFNTRTRIRDVQGDFDEVILPEAFKRSIKQRTPIMQWDHGRDPRVGSTPIGAIQELREDRQGLYVRARLFDNQIVEPVRQAIAERAIRGMSFRFDVPDKGDTWSRGYDGAELREVHDANLYELGPVAFPAYDSTTVSVRRIPAWA